jgi:protein TonB
VVRESVVRPEYPEDAKRDRVGGRVVIQFVVDEDGHAHEFEVIEEVADYPSLSRSALDALEEWGFLPAQKDGEPVSFKIRVPFEFALE